MTKIKELIPGFGCREGKAVCREDGQVVEYTEAVSLCRHWSNNGADQLLIYDLAEQEADHERTIHCLKEIAREIDAPVIVGGWVKRLEDVKKYLYAGASAVFLDGKNEENIDLIKEASNRFGSEKINVFLSDARLLSRTEEFIQLGASRLILDCDFSIRELKRISDMGIPCLIACEHKEEELVMSCFQSPEVEGIVLPAKKGENWMELKQTLKARGVAVNTLESDIPWNRFKLNKDGLIPVIVQDYKTSEVLMLAYMNEEAFRQTLETGRMTYFSRSRNKLWLKGETSGHFQYVKSLRLDCDQDTILAKVHQIGAACHTGNRSCFFTHLVEKEYKESNPLKVFEDVYSVILDRKANPKEGSYTNYLFDKGIDKILKKCGEEATEIIIAAKNPDPEEIKYEISDFLYHVMVLMAEKGISWEEITRELANR